MRDHTNLKQFGIFVGFMAFLIAVSIYGLSYNVATAKSNYWVLYAQKPDGTTISFKIMNNYPVYGNVNRYILDDGSHIVIPHNYLVTIKPEN